MMSNLNGRMTLIDALDEATEPSRLLDSRIARMLGLRVDMHDGESTVFVPNGGRVATPAYTSSLDAAVTAVPNGWSWSYNSSDGEAIVSRVLPGGITEAFNGFSTVAAIALCVAALEARTRAAHVLTVAHRRVETIPA